MPVRTGRAERALSLVPSHETREAIAAGEVYQAVISQRWTARLDARPLRRVPRAAHAEPVSLPFLSRDPGGDPARLLARDAGPVPGARSVETRPIAGTAPRGRSPEEDAALAAALLADPKERAEHVMLVDLARNDLGRVCEIGSVRVPRYASVEKFSHVQHLVSEVHGTLARGSERRRRSVGPAFRRGR